MVTIEIRNGQIEVVRLNNHPLQFVVVDHDHPDRATYVQANMFDRPELVSPQPR